MRLLYYLHLNFGRNSGVYRKIVQQVNFWRSVNHRVGICLVTADPDLKADLRLDLSVDDFHAFNYKSGPGASAVISRIHAISAAARLLRQLPVDMIYTRQDMFYPALRRVAAEKRLVLEINTDDLNELRILSKWRYCYSLLTRRILFKKAAGGVFMTHELQGKPHFADLFDKSIVVANGYSFPVNPVPLPNGKTPHLLFLGAGGMPWHGIDKLKVLAEAQPDWIIDVVGPSQTEIAGSLPLNIKFHGSLLKSQYQHMLESAVVGIGTLALHRKAMQEACALKTREYLAHGLPVILGYKDTDFSGREDFICQLENTEKNVEQNLGKITRFVERWQNTRVLREQVDHLKVECKENQRLRFFERVAGLRES